LSLLGLSETLTFMTYHRMLHRTRSSLHELGHRLLWPYPDGLGGLPG
jgi:hypothetical protein